MFDCFTKHRQMLRTPNMHHPLTCQVCQKADSEERWKCTFCNVRMCTGCFRLMNRYKRDLSKVVEHIENNPPSAGPAELTDGSMAISTPVSGPELTSASEPPSGSTSAAASRPDSPEALKVVHE
jgi:hypothetical protein